jgi:hypothetical protein
MPQGTPVTPALGKLSWEDSEFKASLGHIATPFFKKKKKILQTKPIQNSSRWHSGLNM